MKAFIFYLDNHFIVSGKDASEVLVKAQEKLDKMFPVVVHTLTFRPMDGTIYCNPSAYGKVCGILYKEGYAD